MTAVHEISAARESIRLCSGSVLSVLLHHSMLVLCLTNDKDRMNK